MRLLGGSSYSSIGLESTLLCKGWVTFEHLILDTELRAVPWFTKEHIPHPLIGATLYAFDRACAAHALSTKDCAIIPGRGNPDFPPLSLTPTWQQSGRMQRCRRNTFSTEGDSCNIRNLSNYLIPNYSHSGHIFN